jgi:hypothetical protein
MERRGITASRVSVRYDKQQYAVAQSRSFSSPCLHNSCARLKSVCSNPSSLFYRPHVARSSPPTSCTHTALLLSDLPTQDQPFTWLRPCPGLLPHGCQDRRNFVRNEHKAQDPAFRSGASRCCRRCCCEHALRSGQPDPRSSERRHEHFDER